MTGGMIFVPCREPPLKIAIATWPRSPKKRPARFETTCPMNWRVPQNLSPHANAELNTDVAGATLRVDRPPSATTVSEARSGLDLESVRTQHASERATT